MNVVVIEHHTQKHTNNHDTRDMKSVRTARTQYLNPCIDNIHSVMTPVDTALLLENVGRGRFKKELSLLMQSSPHSRQNKYYSD